MAHLYKQDAVRALASVNLIPETEDHPSLNASAGVQGIATGNPGFSLTAEKNWAAAQGGWNAFVGVGYRTNEEHVHMVAGAKRSFGNGWTLGILADGHAEHPFVTWSDGEYILGGYLIDFGSPAVMFGIRF